MCFGIGVRRFLDDLVIETVAQEKMQVVLSVGAGLDTRPWRLDLAPDLRWIESDLRRCDSAVLRTIANSFILHVLMGIIGQANLTSGVADSKRNCGFTARTSQLN